MENNHSLCKQRRDSREMEMDCVCLSRLCDRSVLWSSSMFKTISFRDHWHCILVQPIIKVRGFWRRISLGLWFCSGEEVVPVINHVIRDVNFDVVAYTYDWHPLNHISFYENRHLRKLAPESPVRLATRFSFSAARSSLCRSLPRVHTFWIHFCLSAHRTFPTRSNKSFGLPIAFRRLPALTFIEI